MQGRWRRRKVEGASNETAGGRAYCMLADGRDAANRWACYKLQLMVIAWQVPLMISLASGKL